MPPLVTILGNMFLHRAARSKTDLGTTCLKDRIIDVKTRLPPCQRIRLATIPSCKISRLGIVLFSANQGLHCVQGLVPHTDRPNLAAQSFTERLGLDLVRKAHTDIEDSRQECLVSLKMT